MTIHTKPTEKLNVSKLVLTVSGGQQFGLTFAVKGYGKYVDGEGNDVWSVDPLVSRPLNVAGDAWNNWDKGVDDETYVGDLALALLGLERDAAPAAEESSEEESEASE